MGNHSGSAIKNSPATQEMLVQSLGRADPLEKEMATHTSILAWRIPWTGESGGLWHMGVTKSWTRLSNHTTTATQFKYICCNQNYK